MTLTTEEIFDLAKFAGLQVGKLGVEMETELTVVECPAEGVLQDDKSVLHTVHIAYYSEYPDEGVQPLGKEIKQNAPADGLRSNTVRRDVGTLEGKQL